MFPQPTSLKSGQKRTGNLQAWKKSISKLRKHLDFLILSVSVTVIAGKQFATVDVVSVLPEVQYKNICWGTEAVINPETGLHTLLSLLRISESNALLAVLQSGAF